MFLPLAKLPPVRVLWGEPRRFELENSRTRKADFRGACAWG